MNDDFTTFVHDHQTAAGRLAVALCGGDTHEAKDLVQTAFERIWSRWDQLELSGINEPGAYLRTVVINSHTSSRRRGWFNREQATDELPEPTHEPTLKPVEDGVVDAEVLLVGLAALPLRQRQAVVLRYLEDLPVAEVAALMTCTPGTVKRAAYDGLRSLRIHVAPHEYEEVADA